MRKITLFLASLFATIGAMAQVYQVTDTKYTSADLNAKTEATYIAIKNLSATNNYYFVGNTGGAPYSKADFTNDAVFIWEPVTGETGSFYLKKLDGTYMQSSAPKDFGTIDNAAKFTTTNPTSTGSGSAYFNGDGDSQAYINGNDDANLVRFITGSSWINVQNGTSGTPKYNTGTGGWTIHYAYAVEEVSAAQVTYNYQLNGVTKKSVTVEQGIGTAYAAPAIDYVTFTQPTGTVPAEGATVNIECAQNLPFTVSESFEAATWYFMTIRSNNEKYVSRSESTPYNNSATITTDDNGLWAFMGNVFDGIQVINKGAGNGQTLGFDAAAEGSVIYMKDGNTSWTIEEGNGGFLLRQDGENQYAHDLNSTLKFWVSASAASDAGSAFKVYLATERLESLLQDWKESTTTCLGYVGGYPATMSESIDAVSTYADALAFDEANATSKIALVPGNYYRVQNVLRERMIGVDAAGQRVPTTIGKTDASQIWTFEAGAEEGKYYIKNLNGGNSGYMKAPNGGNDLTAVDAATLYTLTELGEAQFLLANGSSLLVDYGVKNGEEKGLGSWSGNGKDSDGAWYIIPATELEISLNNAQGVYWSTTYLPFNVTLNDNAEAYYVSTFNDVNITLSPAGNVPAGNAVVLRSESDATVTLNITTEEVNTNIANNKLAGFYVATAKPENALVLGAIDGTVGFYPTSLETLTANRAYLINSNESSLTFKFDNGTTAIDEIPSEITENDAAIFDLSGRRVLNPTKGIYIKGGKKIYFN